MIVEHKRVLLVNCFLAGEQNGTGNTIKNILSAYPPQNLMQLCLDEQRAGDYTSIPNTVFISASFNIIVSMIRKYRLYRAKYSTKTNATICEAAQKVTIRSVIHEFISAILDCLPRHYQSVINMTEGFYPQIIFTCGGSVMIMRTAIKLSRRYKAPIILLLMDDWQATLYTKSLLSLPFRRSLIRALKNCCALSHESFAISEAMAQEYQRKYNLQFVPLMNPVIQIEKEVRLPDNPKKIFTYAGSLSLNRWKSLLEVAAALKGVSDCGYPNEFHLYIPPALFSEHSINLFKQYNAILHEYVPAHELWQVYANSDVLVFVESFDEASSKFARLSLSTKIPEFMGAGRPILAHLPSTLHSGHYIASRDVGLVSNNQETLRLNIQRLIEDESLRYKLACKGVETAMKEHSHEGEHKKFIHALQVSDFSFAL